ncbi:TetR/AcrR family transcriptional regulator [Deinococcus lacus]|uniref:TetR/AcrR family transcriptional regulator n=1 Tax=Deinococcus lacus TaxID=392561 RepID=A0ABW1YIN6_9DEIO
MTSARTTRTRQGRSQQGRSYQGLSAAERCAERRERLLAAARVVYGGQGYRHSTVKAVCDEAGLTQRYFYEEFASQEALLGAAYARAMGEVRGLLLTAWAAEATLEGRVQATASTYFGYLHANPQAARLILLETEGVSGNVGAVVARELAETTRLLREHLLYGAQAGELDPDLLALGLLGAICQLAKAWWTHPQPPSADKMAAHAAAIGLGVVGAGEPLRPEKS